MSHPTQNASNPPVSRGRKGRRSNSMDAREGPLRGTHNASFTLTLAYTLTRIVRYSWHCPSDQYEELRNCEAASPSPATLKQEQQEEQIVSAAIK